MSKMKKIAVLTSGGDAPGMNAAIRAVVRSGIYHGIEVVGISYGYDGLLNKRFRTMGARDVANILGRGGTMLFSARSKDFNSKEGVQRGVDNLKAEGIEGLVCVGGDGTFRGARDLSVAGIPCIGIPATIDNDIASTDYALGFDTALNTVMGTVDKFRDTSESHDRCAVIEVMGRQAGYLAVYAGIAGGAEGILTTDYDYDIKRDIIDRIKKILETGKRNFIVLTAEGVTGAVEGGDSRDVFQLAEYIEQETGVESRAAVLAHMQRGGSPSGRDRVLASMYGNYAVRLLKDGVGNRVVAERENKIVDIDILEALDMKKTIDPELFRLAREISI